MAALIVFVGVVAARHIRDAALPLASRASLRRYSAVVGSEFTVAGIGAAVFGAASHSELIALWVCLVVGAHFVPLNRVFPSTGLTGLGVSVMLVAPAAATADLSTG